MMFPITERRHNDEQTLHFNEVMHLANYTCDRQLYARKRLCQFLSYVQTLLFLAECSKPQTIWLATFIRSLCLSLVHSLAFSLSLYRHLQ
jgi:hypothetical protein